MICKLCKQSFNFNKKLYEHIRNHEILKLAKNSHFSINAVNLICEIEETSFATFKTIALLKRSNLSFFTLEIKSKSTKKSTTCRRCNQIFNFNNKFHEHIRQHCDERASNSTFESTLLSYRIECQSRNSSWRLQKIKSSTYVFANLLDICFSLRNSRVVMY